MMDAGNDPTVELSDEIMNLTADQTVKLVRELCAGLSEDGTEFHGNIWPGSIRIENGQAVLGEGSDAPVSGRTAAQVEYLSPEFFWDNEGTGASDVYSLGLLLYSGCNGGYLPFQPRGGALTDKDRSGALRKRMKGEDVPVPSGVSDELRAVIKKALAYEPEDRYADPAALLAALSETNEALPSEAAFIAPVSAESEPVSDGEAELSEAEEELSEEEPSAEELNEELPAEEPAFEDVEETDYREDEDLAWLQEEEMEELPEEDIQEEVDPPEERRYTVQKDFEKKKGKKAKKESAAPAARTKKKKTSPVIPILCVAAAAVICGGIWYFLNHPLPGSLTGADTEQVNLSEPMVVLTTPEATNAPTPTEEEVHTTKMVDLMESEDAGEESSEEQGEPEDGDSENAEPAVGSPSIDGLDVEAANDTVYVTGSGVNLRSGPGTSYQVSTTLSRGTELERTGTVNGWSQVQYQGKEYYVSSALVSTENPKAEDDKQTESLDNSAPAATAAPAAAGDINVSEGTGTLRVTSDVNIRSGPGTSYDKIGEAKAGTTLTATGVVDGKWYRISYNGKEGYVNRQLVSAQGFSTMSGESGKLEVIADANIRSGPGTSYDKLGEVKEGKTLTMTGHTESNWYQVTYEDQTGYIAGNLVKVVD